MAVSVVREPRVTVAFELDADVVQPATGTGVGVGGATVGVAVGPTAVAVGVGGTEVGVAVAVGAWVGAFVGVLVGMDVFVGVGAPSLVANLIKRAVGRARPELLDSVGSLNFRSFANDWTYEGFPSGHATTIFAAAMVAGFISPRWLPAAIVVAALVGLSRVVVGAHYPTDVIGGAVCGILLAYLVRNVFAWRRGVCERRPDGTIARRGFAATRRFLSFWSRQPAA